MSGFCSEGRDRRRGPVGRRGRGGCRSDSGRGRPWWWLWSGDVTATSRTPGCQRVGLLHPAYGSALGLVAPCPRLPLKVGLVQFDEETVTGLELPVIRATAFIMSCDSTGGSGE